jgi:CO dehydrogenase nickel-insertion accessory protein CooC1
MASEIGIRNISVIVNKIKTKEEQDLIRNEVDKNKIIGTIPYSEIILNNDRDGKSAIDNLDHNLLGLFEDIVKKLFSKELDSN